MTIKTGICTLSPRLLLLTLQDANLGLENDSLQDVLRALTAYLPNGRLLLCAVDTAADVSVDVKVGGLGRGLAEGRLPIGYAWLE